VIGTKKKWLIDVKANCIRARSTFVISASPVLQAALSGDVGH
jgi:hypothetical protein